MWEYKGKVVDSIEKMPKGAVGFIYCTSFGDLKYIGKKALYHQKTLPPLKGKRRKRRKIVESDWMQYYGSSEQIKDLLTEENKPKFKREILEYAFSKRSLTYLEVKYQFILGVLEKDEYINNSILGKFFKGNIK